MPQWAHMESTLVRDELKAAYDRAMIGADSPDEIIWNAGGLKQFADNLSDPTRSEMIAFADACPAGSICVLSKSGGKTYFDPSGVFELGKDKSAINKSDTQITVQLL